MPVLAQRTRWTCAPFFASASTAARQDLLVALVRELRVRDRHLAAQPFERRFVRARRRLQLRVDLRVDERIDAADKKLATLATCFRSPPAAARASRPSIKA